MSIRISLTLEASEMFLSLHMIFSLERAAVVWAILERISGFDPLLEMIAPRYLKFSTSSSLLTFYLDLSLETIWVVCHHFCLVSADLHSVPMIGYRKELNYPGYLGQCMVGRVSYLGRVKQGNYHTYVLHTIPNPNYTLPKPYPFIITYPIHHPTLCTQTGRELPCASINTTLPWIPIYPYSFRTKTNCGFPTFQYSIV